MWPLLFFWSVLRLNEVDPDEPPGTNPALRDGRAVRLCLLPAAAAAAAAPGGSGVGGGSA